MTALLSQSPGVLRARHVLYALRQRDGGAGSADNEDPKEPQAAVLLCTTAQRSRGDAKSRWRILCSAAAERVAGNERAEIARGLEM